MPTLCCFQRGCSGPPDLRTSGSCTLIPASGRHRSHARKRRGGSPAGGRGGPRRRAGVDPPLGLALLPAPPPPGGNCRAPCRGGGAEPIRQGSLRPAFPTPPPPAVRAASCAAPAGFGAAARGAGRLFAIRCARKAVGIRLRSSERRGGRTPGPRAWKGSAGAVGARGGSPPPPRRAATSAGAGTPGPGAPRDPPPTRWGEARDAVGREEHPSLRGPPQPHGAQEGAATGQRHAQREGRRLGAAVPQGTLSDR